MIIPAVKPVAIIWSFSVVALLGGEGGGGGGGGGKEKPFRFMGTCSSVLIDKSFLVKVSGVAFKRSSTVVQILFVYLSFKKPQDGRCSSSSVEYRNSQSTVLEYVCTWLK